LSAKHQKALRCAKLELSNGKSSVCCILKSNACARLTDYKILAGKIVAKGELAVKMLYKSSDESIDTMEYALPISQIIDADGVDDECECDICLNVCGCQLEPADINNPDCRSIKAEASICCFVKCYKKISMNMVSDCYSTKCECKHESKSINLMKLIEMIDYSEMVKERLEAPENLHEIKDIWCEVLGQRVNASGSNAVVACKIAICMFAAGENNEIGYSEKLIETSHSIPLSQECDAVVFTPDICIKSLSYTIASDRLEVRFEISIKGSLCGMYKMPAVVDVVLDETKRKPRNTNKLYICYANSGDNVWDIAKHYNTSCEAVMEENMLDSELLDKKTILLIPIV